MRSAPGAGRFVGLLVLVQLAGLIVPFVLLLPLTRGPESYLLHAAAAGGAIKLAVLLLLVNGALTIGIGIATYPVVRQHSEALALWLVSVGVIMFLLQAVDNVQVLSMLSLSRQYLEAGSPTEPFQAIAATLGATRRWAHLSELLAIDAWFLLFFGILFRYALVPRAVAALALATVLLHFAGVPARMFLGLGPVTPMAASMALGEIAVGGWLVAKGWAGLATDQPAGRRPGG